VVSRCVAASRARVEWSDSNFFRSLGVHTLEGQTVLVTGGGSGIGFGIAAAFAQAGCRVLIAGRRSTLLEQAASTLASSASVLWHVVDVTSRASVQELFAYAREQFGPLDILVNAAGVNIKTRSMSEMTPEQWDEVLAINATGVYNCLYAALPGMRERRSGLILNISSTSGKRAMPLGGVAYNASKFAVSALSTSVALEEAKHGIRVTTIFPGEVDTPILEHRPQPVSAERRASMLRPTDLGHMAVAIARLPPHAHVPELIIKPLVQDYA
jgi:NAD(P)-dependent dehydrogenase (short-subunit alcohol dehydrogenase family)